MPELVVVVPSRGRPHTVAELAAAFRETCTADTLLVFAVDESDPTHRDYYRAVAALGQPDPRTVVAWDGESSTMVEALNIAAVYVLDPENLYFDDVAAIGFMGDDHRPRTKGWDRAYLDALSSLPGIVYGNDLVQGVNLPTQCAMSVSWVRALGHMAPPVLRHLYVDNYWLSLGRASGCITYLPHVVVEHVHPVTGKVEWDEGHVRVNRPELYEADRVAFAAYWREHGRRDVTAVLGAGVSR